MTRDQLFALAYRTELHHRSAHNADGSPVRCRINGKPRACGRPDYFEVPVKHGLRTCFYITPVNIDEWKLPEN